MASFFIRAWSVISLYPAALQHLSYPRTNSGLRSNHKSCYPIEVRTGSQTELNRNVMKQLQSAPSQPPTPLRVSTSVQLVHEIQKYLGYWRADWARFGYFSSRA